MIPWRIGLCKAYLQTGYCRNGQNCRYEHPRLNKRPADNRLGLPPHRGRAHVRSHPVRTRKDVGLASCESFRRTRFCDQLQTCTFFHVGVDCERFARNGSCDLGLRCAKKHRKAMLEVMNSRRGSPVRRRVSRDSRTVKMRSDYSLRISKSVSPSSVNQAGLDPRDRWIQSERGRSPSEDARFKTEDSPIKSDRRKKSRRRSDSNGRTTAKRGDAERSDSYRPRTNLRDSQSGFSKEADSKSRRSRRRSSQSPDRKKARRSQERSHEGKRKFKDIRDVPRVENKGMHERKIGSRRNYNPNTHTEGRTPSNASVRKRRLPKDSTSSVSRQRREGSEKSRDAPRQTGTTRILKKPAEEDVQSTKRMEHQPNFGSQHDVPPDDIQILSKSNDRTRDQQAYASSKDARDFNTEGTHIHRRQKVKSSAVKESDSTAHEDNLGRTSPSPSPRISTASTPRSTSSRELEPSESETSTMEIDEEQGVRIFSDLQELQLESKEAEKDPEFRAQRKEVNLNLSGFRVSRSLAGENLFRVAQANGASVEQGSMSSHQVSKKDPSAFEVMLHQLRCSVKKYNIVPVADHDVAVAH